MVRHVYASGSSVFIRLTLPVLDVAVKRGHCDSEPGYSKAWEVAVCLLRAGGED